MKYLNLFFLVLALNLQLERSHAAAPSAVDSEKKVANHSSALTLEVTFGPNRVKFVIESVLAKEFQVQKTTTSDSRHYKISEDSTVLIKAYIDQLKNSTSHKISFCPVKHIRIVSASFKNSPLLLCFENNSRKSHNAAVLANYLEGHSK